MSTITKSGITLSSNRGSGNATITVTAKANISRYPIEEFFTISAGQNLSVVIRVIQAGATTTNVGNDTETNL